VKNGWQARTLGELCQLVSGQHIDAKDYNMESRGVGYLTGPSDFGQLHPVVSKWTEHPKVKARGGDILITVKGSGVGKINLLDLEEVAISN
jgi:type I restriction enzyme S subunit